jgi:hypothetical protein
MRRERSERGDREMVDLVGVDRGEVADLRRGRHYLPSFRRYSDSSRSQCFSAAALL